MKYTKYSLHFVEEIVNTSYPKGLSYSYSRYSILICSIHAPKLLSSLVIPPNLMGTKSDEFIFKTIMRLRKKNLKTIVSYGRRQFFNPKTKYFESPNNLWMSENYET